MTEQTLTLVIRRELWVAGEGLVAGEDADTRGMVAGGCFKLRGLMVGACECNDRSDFGSSIQKGLKQKLVLWKMLSTIAGSIVANASLFGIAKGITRSGNSVFPCTAGNVVPCFLAVVASTVDREFSSNIYLKGFPLNPTKMERSYGLVYRYKSAAAAAGVSAINARSGTLC